MKRIYSHAWLQSFFDIPLPPPEDIREGLMRHSFEVESAAEQNGDTVYELDILPNRSADCLAHYGIAKEIAAIFSLAMNRRYFDTPFSFAEKKEYIYTDRCDRYTVLNVSDINLRETPAEIQKRLEALGQRSISPLVDLSNYLLFDIGQPTHVFDAAKTTGMFGVRQAKEGETLTLLGGDTITLTPEDTVIVDNDRAVGLAGIKGGEDAGVDADTKDIYVEVATFQGAAVRATMRRLNLTSDAGLRFSQNLPAELIDYTMHRVAEVFGQYGTVTGSYDCRRVPLGRQRKTGMSVAGVNQYLGSSYTEKDIRNVLERLQLPFEYGDPRAYFLDVLQLQIGKPYAWGASVTKDAPDMFDCSSLICFAAAQAGTSLPRMSVNQYLSTNPVIDPKPGDLVFMVSADPKLPLHTKQVYEAGYPVSPGTLERGINHAGVLLDADTVIEAEGDTGERAVVRRPFQRSRMVYASEIWSGGERRFIITVPVERPDIQHEADVIEEIGRMSGYDAVPAADPAGDVPARTVTKTFAKRLALIRELGELGFSEVITYSFRDRGDICVAHPVAKDKGCLRPNLRQGIEEALVRNAHNGELLGLRDIRIMEIGSVFTEDGEKVHLALGVTETVGRPKVNMKEIEEAVRSRIDLPGSFDGSVLEVVLDDIDLTADTYMLPPAIGDVQYRIPSPYPFALRDVAMFVPPGVSAEDAERLLHDHGGSYLYRTNLFDTFVKDGRTSYAFRLVFQSDSQTLDDGIVNEQTERLYRVLQEKGFEVR